MFKKNYIKSKRGSGFAMTYFSGMNCLLLNKCVIARADSKALFKKYENS